MRERMYVTLFYAHHGPRSLPCGDCGRLVLPPWEATDLPRGERPLVHHRNGDRSDFRIENLELMHFSCHMSAHSRNGRSAFNRPEVRAKIRAAQMGKPCPPKTRAKIAASLRGHRCNNETRAKLSVAIRRAWQNPETRKRLIAGRQRRGPVSPKTRAKIAAYRCGQRLSEETRAKISAAAIRRRQTGQQETGLP